MAAASPANRSPPPGPLGRGYQRGRQVQRHSLLCSPSGVHDPRRASAARAARTSRPYQASAAGTETGQTGRPPADEKPGSSPGQKSRMARREPHPPRALDQQRGAAGGRAILHTAHLADRRGGSSRAARWAGVDSLILSCSACSRRLSSLISDTFPTSIAIKPGRRQVSVYEPGNFCRGAEPVRIPVISSPAAASAAGWWCHQVRCAAPPGRRSR